MAFVYILKSVYKAKTYIGYTVDLSRRLREHNNGYSLFSRRYRPWIVVYTEEFDNIQDARKRERYLSAVGRRFIKRQNLVK